MYVFLTSGEFSSIITLLTFSFFHLLSRALVNQMVVLVDWVSVCLICSLIFHLSFVMRDFFQTLFSNHFVNFYFENNFFLCYILSVLFS